MPSGTTRQHANRRAPRIARATRSDRWSSWFRCPTCLGDSFIRGHHEQVGSHLFCEVCGGVFPFEGDLPNLIDVRSLLKLPTELLAVWHLMQLESLSPSENNDQNSSCSALDRSGAERVRSAMDLQGKRILDVGSGSFMLPEYVKGGGYRGYIAVDPIAGTAGASFRRVWALGEMLPFPDRCFDVVIFATSLDHVLDVPATLAEARRVLRTDGRVYYWGSFGTESAQTVDPTEGRFPVLEVPVAGRTHRESLVDYVQNRHQLKKKLKQIEHRAEEFKPLLIERARFRRFCDKRLRDLFLESGYVCVEEKEISSEGRFLSFRKRAPVSRRLPLLDRKLEQCTQELQNRIDRRFEEMLTVTNSITRLNALVEPVAHSHSQLRRVLVPCYRIATLPLRLGRHAAGRVRQAGRAVWGVGRLVYHLVRLAALSGRALRRPPAPKTASGGSRVLMTTISQIDIDPRINKMACSLAERGYRVDILCHRHTGTDVKIETVSPGIRYVRVSGVRECPRLRRLYQVTFHRAAADLEFDIVHAHDLTTLWTGWLIARDRGVPLVYDAHEMWSENVDFDGERYVGLPFWKRAAFQLVEGFLAHRADLFLSVSPSICAEYKRMYQLDAEPLLIPNFPDVRLAEVRTGESIRELCGLTNEHFVSLYLGGVNPARNIENVIKAHAHLPERFVFVIRGPGVDYYRPDYEKLAAECGVADRIFYLPPVQRDEVVAGMRGADCGVVMLRNLCKNFYWYYPNKFFEYSLAGLPVAVSDFPDVAAHTRREGSGVLFDPDDPVSIAAAIRQLAENPDEARAMGERGRRAIFERYNWDAAMRQLLARYEALIGVPHKPPTARRPGTVAA